MTDMQWKGWTFDTVASGYEKLRPGYVPALYEDLFAYCPLSEKSHAVEVGIGAGQATLPVLQTGCRLTAVEYGANFARLCQEKFCGYPRFSVVTGKFETVEFPPQCCDLVFSASAFHWIPEEIGYPKVYAMLKPGGTFARFANHPFWDQSNPALVEAITEAYAAYYYRFHKDKKPAKPKEYTQEQARERAFIAGKYGFEEIRYALYRRTRSFTAQEYTALLGTYSDHIVIEENLRKPFFAAVEKAIEENGGTLQIFDTIDLQLARKPG